MPSGLQLPKKIPIGPVSSPRPFQVLGPGVQIIERSPFSLQNGTAQSYRGWRTNPIPLIRELARIEGPFATAVHNMVEVANTALTISAYSVGKNTFHSKGTNLAKSILASFNSLHDYSQGYSSKKSMETIKKMMIREAILTGRVAAELVLNAARFADRLQVVGAETIKMMSDGKGGAYPAQQVYSQAVLPGALPYPNVPLNIPTFWMDEVHADPGNVGSRSVMEAAIKTLIYFDEFMEDIRRSVRQSGHNRVVLTLDSAKVLALAPQDTQKDTMQLKAWFDMVKTEVETQLQQIAPEDALVMYDSITADALQSNVGSKLDYTPLLNVISALLATSMRTPPGVLGLQLDNGSQNSDNVSTLVFLKSIGAFQTPAETVLSRALTLACRLYGADVYVCVEFENPNLRPDTELEAFYTMRQTRILQQLSLGFIGDDEAANLLKTGPRPKGMPKLSGTFFMNTNFAGSDEPPGNTFPGDTSMGRTLQPPKTVPRKGGGQSQ